MSKENKELKIYLLERTDSCGYDEYDGFVIRAESEEEVKRIAEEIDEKPIWSRNIWYTKEIPPYEIKEIGEVTGDETETIILGSFNAG